jgi:hypothetical protein
MNSSARGEREGVLKLAFNYWLNDGAANNQQQTAILLKFVSAPMIGFFF